MPREREAKLVTCFYVTQRLPLKVMGWLSDDIKRHNSFVPDSMWRESEECERMKSGKNVDRLKLLWVFFVCSLWVSAGVQGYQKEFHTHFLPARKRAVIDPFFISLFAHQSKKVFPEFSREKLYLLRLSLAQKRRKRRNDFIVCHFFPQNSIPLRELW